MMAAEIIGQVLDAGGQIVADGADLALTAPRPLPADLLDKLKANKLAILVALAHPAPLPPLRPAAQARRRRVLALARDGRQYAVLVEDPNTDPVVAAVATPDATGEILIPQSKYNPFLIFDLVKEWGREAAPFWWRVAIQEPGGRTIEVDAPSGCTLADWQAYAGRYHALGAP
jgi:hypothetical protein